MRALLLAFVLLAPTVAASEMAQPAWSEGDTWFYTIGSGGNLTVTVGGLERVAAGTLANAWNVTTTSNGTSSANTWYRDGDLALMRTASPVRTYRLDAPCVETAFPLAAGKSWSFSCVLHGSDGTTQTLAANWTVLREEDVAVPAGAFHTFVLEGRFDNGIVRRDWWAPAACKVVRSETYVGGQLVDVMSLASFHCVQAPDVPTPVISTPSTSPTSPTSTVTPTSTSTLASTPPGASTTPAAPARTPGAPLALAVLAMAALAILRKRS